MPDRAPSGLLWLTVATAVALALLLGLGTWQLQRKAWKDGLIARTSARLHAEPIPLEAAVFQLAQGRDLDYTRVAVRGRFHFDKTLFLFAPERGETGWHAYTPLETPSGKVVLVNRGYVLDSRRNAATAASGPAVESVDMVGLLRHPGVKGLFTPANDIERNVWHWRDGDGMARATFPAAPHTVFPFTIDLEAGSIGTAEPDAPRPGVTRVSHPNRHLAYALTWYALSAALVGVYVSFAWSRWRSRSGSSTTSPRHPGGRGDR